MVGYPIGGDTISVTSGVVSRIEVTSYVHGSTELLGVQIDAAINSGNSGQFLLALYLTNQSSLAQLRCCQVTSTLHMMPVLLGDAQQCCW